MVNGIIFVLCRDVARRVSTIKTIPFPRNGFAKIIKIPIRNAAAGGKYLTAVRISPKVLTRLSGKVAPASKGTQPLAGA